MTAPGFVSLVGAGPGDPDLITRKGARRLAEADLVLYDALVTPETLALAGNARRFPVGKRAGRPSIRQETINALLVRAARQGKRVVRLKCGDPFVLGRGGEEALALAAAGVAYEVVPGVTTAMAAPALAGIPVTHRGYASGFVVVSGHADVAFVPAIDSIAPLSLTIVVLMGLSSRTSLAARMQARGWPAGTPVAVLLAASTPSAYTWRGTLGELADAPLPPGDLPGTIVVGEVAALGNTRTVRSDLAADVSDLAAVAEVR